MVDWKAIDARNREITLNFFSSLNLSKIKTPDFFEGFTFFDSIYRVYHHSFKMYYRFPDLAKDAVRCMFEPLGETDFTDVPQMLDKWGMDEQFKKAYQKLSSMKFDHSKNEPEIWFKEAVELVGCCILILGVAHSTLVFLQGVAQEKSILHTGPRVLNEHEATFLEAWESVGSVLRYNNDKETAKECLLALDKKRNKVEYVDPVTVKKMLDAAVGDPDFEKKIKKAVDSLPKHTAKCHTAIVGGIGTIQNPPNAHKIWICADDCPLKSK